MDGTGAVAFIVVLLHTGWFFHAAGSERAHALFASKAQACAQPHIDIADPDTDDAVCAQQAFWQFVVVIPPDRVQPGIIDLQDFSLQEYRAMWLPDCGGGSGSGPGWVAGKLTIISVDETKVVTKLDLDPTTGWQGESGDYEAAFCP